MQTDFATKAQSLSTSFGSFSQNSHAAVPSDPGDHAVSSSDMSRGSSLTPGRTTKCGSVIDSSKSSSSWALLTSARATISRPVLRQLSL